MRVAVLDRARNEAAARIAWREPRAMSALIALMAFLLLTLEEFVWGTARLDRTLTNLLEHPDTLLLDRISDVFTMLASVEATIPLAVLAVALLYKRRGERPALAIGGAFLVALAVEGALKLLLHHPDVPSPFSAPTAPAPPNSFPSGHVLRAAVLAMAAMLLWPRPSVRVGALIVVAAIGYTRIYAGMHWTSDVVGATLLGWAMYVATAVYARAPRPPARR